MAQEQGEAVDLSKLWDFQIIVFASVSTLVVVFMLVVLALVMRRLRLITSEFESMRQEMRLIEEGVETVRQALQESSGRGRR
jgi:hypothetical protein